MSTGKQAAISCEDFQNPQVTMHLKALRLNKRSMVQLSGVTHKMPFWLSESSEDEHIVVLNPKTGNLLYVNMVTYQTIDPPSKVWVKADG